MIAEELKKKTSYEHVKARTLAEPDGYPRLSEMTREELNATLKVDL